MTPTWKHRGWRYAQWLWKLSGSSYRQGEKLARQQTPLRDRAQDLTSRLLKATQTSNEEGVVESKSVSVMHPILDSSDLSNNAVQTIGAPHVAEAHETKAKVTVQEVEIDFIAPNRHSYMGAGSGRRNQRSAGKQQALEEKSGDTA